MSKRFGTRKRLPHLHAKRDGVGPLGKGSSMRMRFRRSSRKNLGRTMSLPPGSASNQRELSNTDGVSQTASFFNLSTDSSQSWRSNYVTPARPGISSGSSTSPWYEVLFLEPSGPSPFSKLSSGMNQTSDSQSHTEWWEEDLSPYLKRLSVYTFAGRVVGTDEDEER